MEPWKPNPNRVVHQIQAEERRRREYIAATVPGDPSSWSEREWKMAARAMNRFDSELLKERRGNR